MRSHHHLRTLIVAGALIAGAGCSSEHPPEAWDAPPAAEIDANRAIVSAIDQLPGASFLAQNEVGAPKGGHGAVSYLYYAAPDAARSDVVEHFKSAMEGWTLRDEKATATRTTLEFVKGNAWVSITASEVSPDGTTKTQGYVIAVDAKDAAIL